MEREPGEGCAVELHAEFVANSLKYAIQIFVHFVVPIPLDAKTLTLKIGCAGRFGGCILFKAVLATIKLDNKFGFKANKVHDICADRLLATKFESVKAPVAQRIPELSLNARLIASKTTCKIVLQSIPSPGAPVAH